MKKNKIAKAVALAVAGTVLSAGAISTASAHTMYNKAIAADQAGDTDGWVWGGTGGSDSADVPNPGDSALARPGFLGTPDSNNDTYGDTPFGYKGSSQLNWAAMLHGAGAAEQISAADAQTNYSTVVEIDTAQGAWYDGATGWKHQTDIGLIKSSVTQQVHLNLETLTGVTSKFGVTVFEGMDENTGTYNHHGKWNNPGNGDPFDQSNPFYSGAAGQLPYVTHSDNVTTLDELVFTAQAGEIYSIYLGGSDPAGSWNTPVDGYVLDITTSAVPVPAAVWLFGTAMAGLSVAGRRKKKLA